MATAVSTLVLNRSRWHVLAMTLLLAIAPLTQAQDTDRDPPTRAARVVDVVGDAWLFDHETREWTRLTRNQTVGEGDRVRTDDRARLSLRVGSTSIWVDERSDVELSELDEDHTLVQIDRGDVALRLRSADNAMQTRLRTREGTAQAEREGLYRVEQLDRGSKVYAWQGRIRFDWARPGATPTWVGTGEQVEFWWPEGPRAERGPLFSDGFGDWVLAENREEGDRLASSSARYVSPEMTGAEDLDRYGRWESAPEYGTVWIPTTTVVADWAPYRYGRWAWSRHWGWTWVDDAPWGFAPFHYGRWVSYRGRWCWAPGAYVQRPVYAPALVGWVGGPGISVGVTIGNRPPPPRFGWYPLAPREVYVPAYHHSPRYVNRVNDPRDVRDPVTVQRPHRYRDAPNAVSTLPVAGGGIQPMPVRGPDRKPEPGWGRPLPVAPGRGDLAGQLPLAPTRPPEAELPRRTPRTPDANMGWRSEGRNDGQLPLRRDHGPEGQPRVPLPNAAQPAMPAVVPQPQAPQLPVQQQPRPAVEPPQRGGDNMPWRAQQQREAQQRDMQQREAQQREAQQRDMQQREQQQREAQQRDMQQREAQQREMQQREMQQREMQQREQQRRAQPEPPRVQMPQQQPQPQAQPQPQVRPQPRDEGPRRGREDGPRNERRGEPPKQNDR